jgi:hypothetical protein
VGYLMLVLRPILARTALRLHFHPLARKARIAVRIGSNERTFLHSAF